MRIPAAGRDVCTVLDSSEVMRRRSGRPASSRHHRTGLTLCVNDLAICYRAWNRGELMALARASAPQKGVHPQWRIRMNWEQIKGNWNQAKGKVKEKWGDLTDDDLARIEGRRDQLVGRIQERYGLAKEQAERQVSEWERSASW